VAINSPCRGRNRKDIDIGFFVLILGAILALLGIYLSLAVHRRRTLRGNFFNNIAPKLSDLRRTITASGFERLSGRVAGIVIDLQIIPDTLTYRKLPCFWLLVSHIEPMAFTQKISLMVRPTGFESFSHFSQLPFHTSHLPAPFPADISLRSERPLQSWEMDFLRRHAAIFKDNRFKELVLSPQGCRLSWLLQEAHRGRYLIFREAELQHPPFQWDDLVPLLDILQTLRHDLTVQVIKA